MPTSLFSEMDRVANGVAAGTSLEDQRALQLAFELSMLGLSEGSSGCPGSGTGNGSTNDPDPLQNTPAVFEEARSKKSQNMTECVPVPSSEHVAEIVGRQENRVGFFESGFRDVHARPISWRGGLKFFFSPWAPALLLVSHKKIRPNAQRRRLRDRKEYDRAKRKRRSHAVMREIGIKIERVDCSNI
ncbi:RNA-binding protein MEX3B [Ooceraea biroi]|uniref:RNA-binding protein MEX3B n=1 Tax=Ooceraea biroi TaxID=2015173 RepID=A0A026WW77_OOCBI|nr:RNA-binding protein MEX3B [Ooceraea biroi]